MRAASYVGFLATLIVGVGAFAWADDWWATLLLLLIALAIALVFRGSLRQGQHRRCLPRSTGSRIA